MKGTRRHGGGGRQLRGREGGSCLGCEKSYRGLWTSGHASRRHWKRQRAGEGVSELGATGAKDGAAVEAEP